MLIEQAAYGNRWRRVSPAAKGAFALAGLLAAFLAHSPQNALGVALLLAASTLLGAAVPMRLYGRVALPGAAFLLLSCLTLLVSVQLDEHGAASWRYAPEMLPQVEAIAARALAALAALLSLVLTTPLPDLIGLLRRLRTPEILLDLMVLCYRMLFVFSATTRDIVSAQDARLGYSTRRRGLRSLGQLIASLSLGIWLRARALHRAALARNGDGPLRFLTPVYPQAGRDRLIALLAGGSLIVAAMRLGA
ncbi:MAG: cobalt ECF transporter T component CbiQ [Dechloromonas sp.]|nr:MAG: cobalt ECF transporter T component CbiQ [Dechloromonas sp.]